PGPASGSSGNCSRRCPPRRRRWPSRWTAGGCARGRGGGGRGGPPRGGKERNQAGPAHRHSRSAPPPAAPGPRRPSRPRGPLTPRLVRKVGGWAGEEAADDEAPAAAPAAEESPGLAAAEPWAPRRLVRTCLASMADSRAFGPLVAGEAQARDFYAAGRRAFVA